jgi:hypothetical protein
MSKLEIVTAIIAISVVPSITYVAMVAWEKYREYDDKN